MIGVHPCAVYRPGCTVSGVAVGVGVLVSVGRGVAVLVAEGGGGKVAVVV